jgi:DNA adenine methylase
MAEVEAGTLPLVLPPTERHAGRGIVNVAQVPQRSPFRYPGGKTWFVPRVREWLRSRARRPRDFIEPFAGGAIVGLTVAFEGLADRVTLVELDDDIAAVWQLIVNGHAEWLIRRIRSFTVTHDSVAEAVSHAADSLRDRAFATIVRNRVSRGGILAPGAGVSKLGENGKGLLSRWYPTTLCRRIGEIAARRDRIRFMHGDGIGFIAENAARPTAAFFIDPPYTVAGRRLYRHNELDHARLFEEMAHVRGDFLMTYDRSVEIAGLAKRHGFAVREVPMKTTHHLEKWELLIGRDLGWFTA